MWKKVKQIIVREKEKVLRVKKISKKGKLLKTKKEKDIDRGKEWKERERKKKNIEREKEWEQHREN